MPDAPRSAGSLPAELTSFVGRRRELAETKRLLSGSRLVTLTGMGGVGKTRLALRSAAEVRRAFPDGVWFVPLAELRDPGLLPNTIATRLGLQDGLTKQVAGLAEYLEDKQLLLILDNCEHVVAACAVLAAKLLSATSGVRILTTSRQILRADGEQILPVRPLSVPERDEPGESVTLFVDRATAVLPDFRLDAANRESVTRICRRLDGIPLAIELAVVRLRVLSPDQILHRLDDRFRLLTTGSRNALPRQQTLEAAIAWSFDLCTEAEQAVWAAVSVFAGGFDLDAAEAVCTGEGIERGEVLDLIAGMVDKSVVMRRNGTYGRGAWYHMLETVREYGQAKLAESGLADAVRARHVEYCAELARQYREQCFSPRQLDWVDRLRREHANLRVALEYCLADASRARRATEIASALRDFWTAGGFTLEGHRWLAAALAQDTEPTRARAGGLAACAHIAVLIGETDSVQRMLTELRALAERFDDDFLRAGLAQSSGLALFAAGDASGGCALMDEALAGYRRAGDLQETCDTLLILASITFFLDDPGGASAAEEALALCETHEANWSRSYALWAVALHKWRRGEFQRAASLLREAIGMRLTDRTQLALTVNALAWCAEADGKHERAAGLLGAAEAVWRLSGARALVLAPYHAFDEQCAQRARTALGADAFTRVFDATATAGLDAAIAYALAEKQRPAARPRRADALGGLTRREREIAELVAEGLSNREIAARLVIAQRTAETHVENILAKLGFTSRAQIAAWLAEHRVTED